MQTYKQYKESGIDWIGPIPEHWDLIKLKHVFREKPKTLNPTLSAGSISFGKVIYKNDEKIPESTKASYQEVLAGDFLINPLNLNYDLISLRIALSAINVVVSSGYIVLQDITEINKDFYKWFLHQYDVSYMKLLGSGVRQTINFNHIANSLLAFPPIHEQEAIANFLDDKTAKIDALVQTKEQQIEKLKELRQAKIHQAVTKGLDASAPTKDSGIEWIGEIPAHWEVKRLKHLMRINNGLDYKHVQVDEGYPVIGSGGQFAYSSNYLYDGEVLFLGRKGTIDKPLYFSGKFWTVDTMFYCVVNNKGITKYLYYFSTTIPFKFYSTATALPSMTQGDLNNHNIPIPSIQEQEQIVAYLDKVTGKIDQAIAQKQEQITKLKEYKQSLINDVVTGKVKVC